MQDERFLKSIQPLFGSPLGLAGQGDFGISHVSSNQPTRFFRSLAEAEKARCAFIQGASKGLDSIRLARETKYYVHGRNVPNRV
jgi:hypothetical protein